MHHKCSFMNFVYRRNKKTDLTESQILKKSILDKLDFTLPRINGVQESDDGTVKFLIKFKDRLEVESVLIPFYKRYTICLSAQVGCAMNCNFCFTGTQGFKRNLSAGEIVGQYIVVNEWLNNKKSNALKPNIVFMGQGEPLQNFHELEKSIKVFTDPKAIGLGHRQITLSTVGYLPNVFKINNLPRINIALSLHSPFEEERNKLIPIGKKYPLSDVLKALDDIPLLPRQFITIEYLLIKDLNMSDAHALKLNELLQSRKVIINLIPFNPFPKSQWERPSDEEVEIFKNKLISYKLRVMIRRTKGADILAACGQLKVQLTTRINGTT